MLGGTFCLDILALPPGIKKIKARKQRRRLWDAKWTTRSRSSYPSFCCCCSRGRGRGRVRPKKSRVDTSFAECLESREYTFWLRPCLFECYFPVDHQPSPFFSVTSHPGVWLCDDTPQVESGFLLLIFYFSLSDVDKIRHVSCNSHTPWTSIPGPAITESGNINTDISPRFLSCRLQPSRHHGRFVSLPKRPNIRTPRHNKPTLIKTATNTQHTDPPDDPRRNAPYHPRPDT